MTNSEVSGWIGAWSPGIGDPTIIGWLTVVFYAVAAVMCWRAAHAGSFSLGTLFARLKRRCGGF